MLCGTHATDFAKEEGLSPQSRLPKVKIIYLICSLAGRTQASMLNVFDISINRCVTLLKVASTHL